MPQINASAYVPPIYKIYSPAGVGKTRTAMTLSKHYVLRPPEERTSMIPLTDVLVLQFDRNGIQSVQSIGLDPYFYDLSAQPANLALWLNAVMDRLQEVPEFIKKHGIEWVVVDTFSSMVRYIVTSHLLLDQKAKNPNMQRAYGRAQLTLEGLLPLFKAIPVPQLWLSHSKSVYMDTDQDIEDKVAQRKASNPGEHSVDLQYSPSIRDYIRALIDFAFPLIVDYSRNERYLLTQSGGDYYVKNRCGDLLAPHEPPDLRALFNKIEAAEARMRTPAATK